jgi:hypothetical protein
VRWFTPIERATSAMLRWSLSTIATLSRWIRGVLRRATLGRFPLTWTSSYTSVRGNVAVSRGHHLLTVELDHPKLGVSYTCEVVFADGSTRRTEAWTDNAAPATCSVVVDDDGTKVDALRILGTGGKVRATEDL